MKPRPFNAAILLSMALAYPLSAQVTVNGTGSSVTTSATTTPGSSTYTYTLANPATARVIVAGYYNDNGTAAAGMTFAGNAATKFAVNVRTSVGCYILPEPAPASIAITATLSGAGAPTAGFFIYELAGVDTSGGAASIDSATGATITTTGADKFVLNFKGINNSTGAGTVPASGSIIPSGNAAVFDINGGIGGGALCRGHGSSGPAGTKTLGWTAGADGEVALAFVQLGDPDTDDDGLTDEWELGWAAITDLTQLNGTITTPSGSGNGSGDWDGDGHSDSAEFNGGVNSSDPTTAGSVPGDVDGDGFADTLETTHFGNLNQTPGGDFDGDYATNMSEISAGTSPTNSSAWPDTDSDLMADGWETAHGLVVGTDDSAGHADADGFTNLEEFQAGTDPQDALWAPGGATLAHRWSFSGSLADSVGGSAAQIANDDTLNVGLSSSLNPTGLQLFGGAKATSDYVVLGENLLSSLQSGGVTPVTIELWATQEGIRNWSRIFDFGVNDGINPGPNESLRMAWSQGTNINADQVAWEPTTSWAPGNAPYVVGVPYHIVMTIVPAVFTNGAITTGAQVTWYTAPASGSQAAGHPLYGAKGTFNTDSGIDLRALLDSACTLGRSLYTDNTALATYDEMRIWKGALSETERELFQLLGPDNINRADVDADGFPDAWETARFGNLTTATAGVDSDGDGESDDLELLAETHPDDILSTAADSDKDNLEDAWEMQYFRNLLQLGDDDPDGDFASNEVEEANGTNPADQNSSPDLDGDGISDGWEQLWFGNLTTAQTTLNSASNTNFDGDLDTDLEEFEGGFNPTDEYSGRDTDVDQLPDYWEYVFFQPVLGGSYLAFNGANDYDNDDATHAEEFADGTSPTDANDFRDVNDDGIYDGIALAASDGFGATSFNAGTNWTGGAAPVAGKNYMVNGFILRTPPVANQTTVFAGASLAIADGQLWLKGTNSVAQANYILDGATVRQAEDGNPVTLAGEVSVYDPSVLFADNGTIVVSAKVTGSGGLTLNGNATAIREVHFTNATNTWSGNVTVAPTASLIVHGVLNPGAGSVYNLSPQAGGVTNSIGGTGALTLAGTLNIDLSAATPTGVTTWNLLTIAPTFDPGFTVTGSGFTPDGGAVGARVWTSGDGNYQFDEASGVLGFVGTLPGYTAWSGTAGLTAGVNDGAEDNPEGDSYHNVLEYQLGGNPLAFDGDLVTASETATHLVFTFERFDASENDSALSFRWGTSLATWNTVLIGAVDSGPDANGVVVDVTEDGGSSADYDLIQVRLPKTNAGGGKLFGQLHGAMP
jgi:hypothetical protein